MKRRILTVVLILCLVLTAAAVAAVGTEGAVDPNAISQVQLNFDGGNVPVCPYCGTQPENGWTALDTDITQWQRLNGHYYLTGDRTNSSYYGVVGGNACVYFGDYDVTAANQFAFQVEGGTLTLMGRGDVTGNHNSSMNVGGTIDVVGGTLNLCGGTYRKGVVNGCAVLTMRSGAGTVHMYEGTTICEGNADIGNGGNVRIASGSAFYMHGGQIRDGIAVCGGNIAVEHEAAIFHMYGGTVSGGFAQLADGSDNDGETYALGGNIYVSAGSVKQEKGASISGGTAYTGGNIYFTGGKTVELAGTVSGGTAKTGGNLDIRAYSKAVLSAGAMVSGGTADYDGGNIQLYHATLEIAGGNVSGGTAGRWGGSIFADGENSQVLLRAGNISGGETTGAHGGNICVDNQAALEITGGTVTGGKALHATNGKGGNIYVGAASVQISGGTLTMGQAAVSGGNLCIAHEQVNEQAYTIDGCQIVHGQAAAGGNICTVNSSLKIGRNAVITEGVSSWPKGSSFAGGGGNIFCQGGQMLIYGQISDGTANLTGGNMELRGTVVQLLDGGKVSDGRADYDGGNVYLNQNASFVISNSTVSGGAAGRSGDNILAEGWAVLEGNAQAWDNGGILLGSAAHLRVYKDFSGEVAVDGLDLPVQPYGEVLDPEHFECTGNYSGKIWLPQFTDKPCLFGDGNKLFVGAVYTVKNGGKTWFADNASAVTGYGEADYLVPVGDVTLTGGTYTVDLAGQDLKITGEGRLYCFDSSNDSYKSCGSAVISGPVLKNELAHTVQGKHYIRIRTDGVYSFHRLNLRISDVSLRMNNVGIYYSALWECDDAAASVIQGFGIGVSLADMPTETLRYDEDTKHTYHSRSEFVSGIKTQGVLIQNVFRPYDPEDPDRSAKNSLYGRLPIYAKAYVVLDNGVDRIQTLVSNDNVALSMHDVLSSIDEDMTFYYSAAQRLCDFRDYWHRNGLNDGNWDFTFSVPVQIVQLQQLYSGTNGVTGQLVSDAGQSPSLEAWKEQLTAAGMNFVSVPGQGRNPVSENWDSNAFIAGLEATLTVDGTKVDCNFLFADETQLCNVLSYGDVFTYDASAKTFTVKDVDAATFVALVEQVRANDGLVLLSDPKQTGMADSQDALDYWYTDGVAMDVFHTADSQQNYKLWTDLLAEGKRVWAAASNAAQPVGQGNVIALQAAKNSAQAYMQKLASGNYSCGPVAILMAVGDAPMGSSIDFTGKELAFCVDEAVTGVLEDGHTYRLDLISSKGVLQSWAYNGRTMFKVVEADVNQAFYRMELVDETTGQILSLSNPIWNESYGLRLGFARQDITPDYTVQIVGGKARVSKGVVEGDGIFLTCVAMQEGDQTYLLFTADLISADSSRYVANLKRAVSNATGIPVANIVFSTTHTHSSVGVGVDSWTAEAGGTENLNRFRQDLYAAAETVAAAAIDDLAVVDAAYAGSVTGKTDVAFVRHYEKRDGTVDYSNEGGYETAENILQVYTKGCQYKAHATEADNEIQLVKFERAGAENVILMSVPAHATLNENSEKLSADFPHYARTYIEKQTGSKVACFIGAAGDQVPRSKLSNYYLKQTMNVSNNTDAKVYGEKLGSYAVEALDRGLPQLRSTAIKASYIVYEGTLGTDHFDQYETAKELAQRVAAGEENIDATCRSNGFAGSSDVSGTVKRYEYYLKNGTDLSMGLRIMAVGELGFVFAPYEMSGANGRQLKDAAPYATTFIASCTDDNVSYVASQDAFDHESYEAQCCWFEAGTGELLARYIAEALEQQKFNIR